MYAIFGSRKKCSSLARNTFPNENIEDTTCPKTLLTFHIFLKGGATNSAPCHGRDFPQLLQQPFGSFRRSGSSHSASEHIAIARMLRPTNSQQAVCSDRWSPATAYSRATTECGQKNRQSGQVPTSDNARSVHLCNKNDIMTDKPKTIPYFMCPLFRT